MSPAQNTIEHGLLLEEKMEWETAVEVYTALLAGAGGADAELAFRLGHAHFHLRQFEESAAHLHEATLLNPAEAAWHYRLGYVQEQLGNYDAAVAAYKASLALEPGQTRRMHRLAAAEASAEQAATASVEMSRAESRRRVQQLVENKAPVWQQIEALNDGLSVNSDDPEWLVQLAEAQFSMNRFAEACENFAAAALLKPEQADLHFLEGWCWELLERPAKARHAYNRAIAADADLQAKDFGVGVFFQKKGRWVAAADAYRRTLRLQPTSAELHYRIGYALVRSYKWREAIELLRLAVAMDPSVPQWHYRLGFAHERLAEWNDAAFAYEYAIGLNSPAPTYWLYRLGYVLTQANDFQGACLAFAATIKPAESAEPTQPDVPIGVYERRLLVDGLHAALNSQSAQRCLEAGNRLEMRGMHALAAEAFDAAVKRTENHSPNAYYKLGRALQETGDFEAACRAYLETRLFKRPHGVNTAPYRKNKELNQTMIYTEFLETLPVAHSTVLYESSHGNSVSCNPLQICRNLLDDPQFDSWTHIWVLNDKERVPLELAGRTNVIFVTRESNLYLRHLSTAKYLINNTSFPPYFLRRPEQQYLNTWHGTPLKTLGKDVKVGFFEHRNIARNLLQTTHIIVPNVHTRNALIEAHDIQGLYTGKVALTGYPRTDTVVNATIKDQARIRAALGLDPTDTRPVVLFAPTWRGGVGSSYFDAEGLKEDLERLRGEDRHVFLRAHRFAEDALAGFGFGDWIVPQHIDTNELLAGVDVLITDYSSIFFDFLPTGRTILFYTPDLEHYQNERGLYFEMESMPGVLTKDIETLAQQLSQALKGPTTPFVDFQAEFCPKEDGRSAVRAVDFFFRSDDTHLLPDLEPQKTNLLFHQSLIPNGITTSFVNLMKNLDTERYRAVLLFDANAVASESVRMNLLNKLPDHVQLLARSGRQLFSAEEKWVNEKFAAQHELTNSEQYEIAGKAYGRELARLIGNARFEYICEFDGYSRFWTGMFAHGRAPGRKHVIYLHNQMMSEQNMKYPYLQGVFNLYRRFDSLISVSKSVNASNMTELSAAFGLEAGKFSYANNPLDPDMCLELAESPLPESLDSWLKPNAKLLVSVGRLSPEKAHERLIRAFSEEYTRVTNIQLVLVGDGPLKARLTSLVENLGLEDKVLLLGALDNPFPVVKRADGFILPSLHEGQGLVLLEALILGKIVIATDISGPRSVLASGAGLLVENSLDGIRHGLRLFIEGQIKPTRFDVVDYQRRAIEGFRSVFAAN
ncbi:CDP-glycerol glycerophosphotransferase [Arthrobacter sp. 49Tsu3.1M3]|uniref:CDP-glycerol glycerophosphotransferase family protein n=1 Tax=Arthrobacter sp. 49Tsu3.1M3 TaxID=1279029 RepID=UPI0009A5781A|nr:CDP-glycerol glycerophosphotransferase family protein [Arthrobacter sp. 49Tsu3.1M3]SKB82044.1 CDP-glycerol glycerophosphotransferase [Arthrobacter sp. 49Tsu3.1M3]